MPSEWPDDFRCGILGSRAAFADLFCKTASGRPTRAGGIRAATRVAKDSNPRRLTVPIYERDPWRVQYFTEVNCPLTVRIPTDDEMACQLNPRHRWVYDKYRVAQSQNLQCGLFGTLPHGFPVFSKPVINLRGMGIGSTALYDATDYREHCKPGNFWSTLLTGEHVSTDLAVVRGKVQWVRHTQGIPAGGGTFDYWIVQTQTRPSLEKYCRDWIEKHLSDYTGMLNLETIGGRIIDVHLRFSDQWPDLYGRKWLMALVQLYQYGTWDFADSQRAVGYSVVLFGPHGMRYLHPSRETVASYANTWGVSSIQITFLENMEHSAHAMPPGGFRLAIINCFNRVVGFQLRMRMARDFGLNDERLPATFAQALDQTSAARMAERVAQ